jgi:hypothetical protein
VAAPKFDPAPSAVAATADPVFLEHRTVPWSWWVIGPAIAVPSTEAVVVLGPEMSHHPTALLAVGCLVATVAVIAVILVLLGRSDVRVDSTGLRAGPAKLAAADIGRSRALDRAASRRLLGPGLRADARLSLRPWIKTAVQIEVRSDSATPYWVVATRRPGQLVAALGVVRDALDGSASGQGEPEHDLFDPEAER